MEWSLAIVAAFFLGALPWGLWIGRLTRGIDVRRHGSGNLGATNVYRVLGARWGVTVLLLDAGKGFAAVLLTRALLPAGPWPGLAASAAAILGHSFSPFAGFRGGKGVATAAGAWGALAPLPLAAALAVFAVVFGLTRIVSAGSLAAAALFPVAVALLHRAPAVGAGGAFRGAGSLGPVFWFSVLTAVLIVLRHRSNLRRLLRREEKPLPIRDRGEGRG